MSSSYGGYGQQPRLAPNTQEGTFGVGAVPMPMPGSSSAWSTAAATYAQLSNTAGYYQPEDQQYQQQSAGAPRDYSMPGLPLQQQYPAPSSQQFVSATQNRSHSQPFPDYGLSNDSRGGGAGGTAARFSSGPIHPATASSSEEDAEGSDDDDGGEYTERPSKTSRTKRGSKPRQVTHSVLDQQGRTLPKERKYITVRCEFCRSLHQRCSGHRPSCERCLDKGAVCVYPSVVLKRGPKGKRKQPVEIDVSTYSNATSGRHSSDELSGSGPMSAPPSVQQRSPTSARSLATPGSRSRMPSQHERFIQAATTSIDENLLPLRRAESATAASALYVMGSSGTYPGQQQQQGPMSAGSAGTLMSTPTGSSSTSLTLSNSVSANQGAGNNQGNNSKTVLAYQSIMDGFASIDSTRTLTPSTIAGVHRHGSLEAFSASSLATDSTQPSRGVFDVAASSTSSLSQAASRAFYSPEPTSPTTHALFATDSRIAQFSHSDLAAIEQLNLSTMINPALIQSFGAQQSVAALGARSLPRSVVTVPPLFSDPLLASDDPTARMILAAALRAIEPSTFDLHLPNFLAYFSSSPASQIDPFLLDSLLLRAAKVTLQPKPVIAKYRDRVVHALPSVVSSGNGNVGTVLALGWCAEWLVEGGDFANAHRIHSSSLTLAKKLGLFSDPAFRNGMRSAAGSADEWISREERRRTLWKLYAMDTAFVAGIGAPAVMVDEECATDLPCNDYIWFATTTATPPATLPAAPNAAAALVSLPPGAAALDAIPTNFLAGDRRPLFLMLARIQRGVYAAMRKNKAGQSNLTELSTTIGQLDRAFRTSWRARLPQAVRDLDEHVVGTRPADPAVDTAGESRWRQLIQRVRLIRFAEGGAEKPNEGIFDVEWIFLLWSYHGGLFVLNGPEMHGLKHPNGMRWSEAPEYPVALAAARRMTDLATLLEARWTGGGPSVKSAAWFHYIAPPIATVTTLYYTASIWLEELRSVARKAQADATGDHRALLERRPNLAPVEGGTNHSALRDLALACIAASDEPGEASGDADHHGDVSASTTVPAVPKLEQGADPQGTTTSSGGSGSIMAKTGADSMISGGFMPSTPLLPTNELARSHSGLAEDPPAITGGHPSPLPGTAQANFMRDFGFPDLGIMGTPSLPLGTLQSPMPTTQSTATVALNAGGSGSGNLSSLGGSENLEIPREYKSRAREALSRFHVHLNFLRRYAKHVRVAAGCAEALETLWKADSSMAYVEEVLLR